MLLTSLVCAAERLPRREGEAEEGGPALPAGPVPAKAPIDGEVRWRLHMREFWERVAHACGGAAEGSMKAQ